MSAEYLFKKYLEKNNITDIEVTSAGTSVIKYDFYDDTLNRLNFYEVDPLKHKQTQVDKEILKDKNFIICFTQRHMDYITDLGFKPILFNKIAYDIEDDLMDDIEYASKFGYVPNQKEYIYHTIDYINQGLPNLYKWLLLNNK